ncbi:hypothetical protein [Zooshikella ganghwensis]|nr:hypothetical protein [Zooshikella ganghwensis]
MKPMQGASVATEAKDGLLARRNKLSDIKHYHHDLKKLQTLFAFS